MPETLRQPLPGEGVELAQVQSKSVEEQLAEARTRLKELEATLTERENFHTVTKRRRVLGLLLGFFGILGLIGIAILSFKSLHAIGYEPYAKLPVPQFWAIAVGHALMTMAFVYFCYQLLRAAERLILPYWWVEGHPETARLMLGMTDPLSTASKMSEQLVDAAAKIVGVTTKLKS